MAVEFALLPYQGYNTENWQSRQPFYTSATQWPYLHKLSNLITILHSTYDDSHIIYTVYTDIGCKNKSLGIEFKLSLSSVGFSNILQNENWTLSDR